LQLVVRGVARNVHSLRGALFGLAGIAITTGAVYRAARSLRHAPAPFEERVVPATVPYPL
jgi:hypothetical protein